MRYKLPYTRGFYFQWRGNYYNIVAYTKIGNRVNLNIFNRNFQWSAKYAEIFNGRLRN